MCLSKLCTLLSLADYFFHKLFSAISKQIFSKFLDANQLWGVVDVVDIPVAIQRDPATLERWADRNTMKTSTGKCQVLHKGRNRKDTPHAPEQAGADWLKSGSEEKGLDTLVFHKLNMIVSQPLNPRWPTMCCISKGAVCSSRASFPSAWHLGYHIWTLGPIWGSRIKVDTSTPRVVQQRPAIWAGGWSTGYLGRSWGNGVCQSYEEMIKWGTCCYPQPPFKGT